MRMAIFVDGANLFYCQRDILGWWIDWQRFINYFRRSHRVDVARYYRALKGSTADEDEAAFGQALVSGGYAICEKPLKEVFDKYSGQYIWKGNLDVELALDAYDLADSYDHCLLVSGDGDFVALVDRLRTKGKMVTVASTRGSVAHELRLAAETSFFDLRRYRPKFERLASRAPSPMAPATDRGNPAVRRRTRPDFKTPPGTIPIHSSMSLESPYEVGDQFTATIRRATESGILVDDPAGWRAFLALSHLKLSSPVTDVVALVQGGETCTVRVIELRPGRTRAVIMVELADSEYRQVLETRFAHRAAVSADPEGPCK